MTKELVVDPRFNLLENKPNQIYSNVTIHGNLKIGTLELDKYTRIFLNNEEINLKNIFDTFWTKSNDQIIENDVIFENSLIIDRLNAKYLNGFSEEEFLYTTAKIIPESFRRLHFENVHVNDMLFTDGKNDSLFEIAPESITIRERLHLKQLRGNQLLTDTFNGLPVADILNRKQPHIFPQNMNFSTIKVKRINIDELTFPFSLQNSKNDSKDQKTKFMKTPEFHVENLNVENINNLEMKRLLSLKNMKISDLKDLVIHGDLTIKIDLKVIQIDDQPSMTYIKNIGKGNILFNNNNNNNIQELIAQNITLKSLHNHDMNNFFENFLSKSRKQNISGRFTFYKINTDNIKTSFINHQNVSKLAWINKPLFLMKNVEFDDLFVEGNTITKTLNKLNVNEVSFTCKLIIFLSLTIQLKNISFQLYENMLNISIPKINNLKVDGNISWDVSSKSSAFVTLLFENAVTKTTYQIIRNGTIFQGNVSVSTITGQSKEIDEIRNIIEDSVIDDNDIEIIGQKSFKENLHVDVISVADDIDIPVINNINILEFNNSVVWKNQKETITGIITFLDDVTMDQILIDDKVRDVLLKGVVLTTDELPNHIYFKDLVILKDAYLKNLDEVNFDEFLKDRVTIDKEYELLANIQFNDTVEIIGT